MSDATEIYGHEFTMPELNPGDIITDILIIARCVQHDEDGNLTDCIVRGWTPNTTPVIRAGLIDASRTIEAHKWEVK